MSIKEIERQNIRQLETLKRKNERETRRLEEEHQKLKSQVRQNHEQELVELQQGQERQVATEADKKEKVLTQMRTHLEESQRLTQKQLNDLKAQVSKTEAMEREKLNLERERIKNDHDLHLEDANYRYSRQLKKVNEDAKAQMDQLKSAKFEEISSTEEQFQDRLQRQRQDFTARFQSDSQHYQTLKDDQDNQFKRERAQTNLRQQVEMGKITSSHEEHIKTRDESFRTALKNQDTFFEKRYAEHLKHKEADYQRLNDLHQKVVDKMKQDLQQKLEYQVNRADDPFYRFSELNPKLKQFEDRVEISVEVPEYAKEDLHLGLNNKEAILTFNRRYDDTRREGSATNRIHKVESMTTRIATGLHLDPKGIKSSYQDGIMTYVVKRA